MQIYEPKNLKKQFKQLERLSDFVLIPIFDRVINYFLSDLNHDLPKYGVSDYKQLPKQFIKYSEGLWGLVGDKYHLVVDGKIISMTTFITDINAKDYDELWWMIYKIVFEGNDEGVNKLFERFKRFVGQQNLDELIKAAEEELQKGKTECLSRDIYDFYLGKSKTGF